MKTIFSLLLANGFFYISFSQTPVPMSTQPGLTYTENFADIANWTNNFAAGIGSNRFASVAVNATGTIPSGTRITTSTFTFSTGTSGGVQRGSSQTPATQSIVLISTGATDNTTSSAIDFLMDFTGVNAGTLSFDWASVNNSTGDRKGSLRVYFSTDGATFNELTTAQVLNFTNNSLTSGSITSVALPSAFNNSPTARLRFYYHNGVGGTVGSRPKISIDNLTVTATTSGNNVSVASGSNASEPSTGGNFTITFSASTNQATDVNYSFSGTAGFGTDYTASFSAGTASSSTSGGTLTVPSGTSAITVTLIPIDDASVEGTENITLTLSNPSAGYILGTAAATINLTDNDIPPTVSVAAGIMAAEASTDGSFNITLSSSAPAGGVTINYTLSGTASLNNDYTDPQNGSVIIGEGNISAVVMLHVTDDVIQEALETIIITLNNATNGYVIATAIASINLSDNEIIPIPLTGMYSQDFNTLATSGTTNTLNLNGWIIEETGGGARDDELYAADNGSSNTGDTYSYGTTSLTDRALGSLQSGTLIPSYGAYFINNSGTTITTLKISFTGEQWRLGTAGRTDKLEFQYSLNATNLKTGVWTNVGLLDFITPGTTIAGAKDGNDAANRSATTQTITGLSIPGGSTFFLRWNDFNATGADDGLAIDDFSIEANPADVNLPVITSVFPAMGVGNVSINLTASVTFDETVQKGAGNIVVKRTIDNSVFQTIDVNAPGVVVSTTTVSFNLTGLGVNSGYYIEIDNGAFEDLAGNDFAGINGSSTWAFTTGILFYAADFNTCSSSLTDGFTQNSVTGVITWGCTAFGRDPANPAGTAPFPYAVQINGFSGGTNVPNVDWLISSSFDLTGTIYPLLSFWSRTAFNGAPLQLKVSTDYTGGDPGLATWSDINGKFPAQTSNIWTPSSNINLSAFKQSNVHFAFVYTSSDEEGARWTIDDISITNSAMPPPPDLTVGTNDILYNFVANGATADKTFNFIGNDLIADVTLTSTGPFLLSKDGTTFNSSLLYTIAEANNVTKTVYVRFAPTQSNQNFTGIVIIRTSNLTDTIDLKGTSIDPITTLEVVNWNIEWFGSTAGGPSNDNLQEQNIKTILQNLNADVYALAEVVSETRLANVVNQMPGYVYVISNYGSHTNTSVNPPGALAEAQKLAFIYKTSVLSNVNTAALLSQGLNSAADLTNPAYNYWASGRFPFIMSADVTLNCVTKNVKFVLVHGKANTSPTNISYNRRKSGSDTLYYTLNQLYPADNIIILGDFNDDLDQSITAGFTTTSWDAFTTDGVNYSALTLPLSLAGKRSTVSYNDVIDHVVVSNDMQPFYMNSTASILTDVTSLVNNYGSTTTDHYPVFTRYVFKNTIAPSITSCPTVPAFCANTNTTYSIPSFAASDDCGNVNYSYVISGATEKSGTTNNASGTFKIGTSIITWTATDGSGNTSSCQTTVIINANPTVDIPDTYAMSSGVLPNTVYIGYIPASSVTLTSNVSGGTPGYFFNWSGGGTAASSTVSPTANTTYILTVTDAHGCQATATRTIAVTDVRGIKNRDKVILCHKPNAQVNSLEVAQNAVVAHLAHGDLLGSCTTPDSHGKLSITAFPNPSSNYFIITLIGGNTSGKLSLRVINMLGRTVEQIDGLDTNQSFGIGNNYPPGIYFVESMQGKERVMLELVKLQ